METIKLTKNVEILKEGDSFKIRQLKDGECEDETHWFTLNDVYSISKRTNIYSDGDIDFGIFFEREVYRHDEIGDDIIECIVGFEESDTNLLFDFFKNEFEIIRKEKQ